MTSTPADVSAVVCTLDSAASIRECLASLRQAGVGELIVVDGGSTDGTVEAAGELADVVLSDPGQGLGHARNIGIAASTRPYVLNMGSDNVMPPGQLDLMIADLEAQGLQGVSAATLIEGDDYVSRSLNDWRLGRFRPGPAAVIGTPTLFVGSLLRAHPYDASRRFSDDSELCERWSRELRARFAISTAYVTEIGKTSWSEVVVRCRMYGISDAEVFSTGSAAGWSARRKAMSLLHPARVDFVQPMVHLAPVAAVRSAPFLASFAAMRYYYWATAVLSR